MPLAQLDEKLLPRVVVNACQRLKRQIARGLEAGLGQMSTADDVGINGQAFQHFLTQGGAGKARVMDADAAGALEAQMEGPHALSEEEREA